MGITNNWGQHADRLRRLGASLPKAMREGTKRATYVLHARSKELLNQLIYSIPEDRYGFSYKRSKTGNVTATGQPEYEWATKDGHRVKQRTKKSIYNPHTGKKDEERSGRKKWTRTGNLRRSEVQRVLSDTEGLVHNDAAYALPRHDLGIHPGDPRAIKGSKRESARVAPFRKKAIADTADKRLQAYHDALYGLMSRK